MQATTIKVLHLDGGKGWRGGQRQVHFLVSEQQTQKHIQAYVACPPGSPLFNQLSQQHIPVYGVHFRNSLDLIAVWSLHRLITRLQIDLVHCHCAHSHAIAYLLSFINQQAIIVTRRVDFVPNTNWIGRKKYTSPRIAAFVPISNAISTILNNSGVQATKLHTIPSSALPPNKAPTVDEKKRAHDALCQEIGCSEKTKLVGTIAHFADHKGHRYLVDCAAILCKKDPSITFVLAGDGNCKKEIEQRVQQQGLSQKVLFLGFRKDTEFLHAAFDVFLITSHLEGLCSSIIDAFFAKTIVVASNTGGIPDLVISGKTGFLAKNKNPQSFADNVHRALQSKNKRETYIENAYQHARSDFTCQAMATRYTHLYKNILRKIN